MAEETRDSKVSWPRAPRVQRGHWLRLPGRQRLRAQFLALQRLPALQRLLALQRLPAPQRLLAPQPLAPKRLLARTRLQLRTPPRLRGQLRPSVQRLARLRSPVVRGPAAGERQPRLPARQEREQPPGVTRRLAQLRGVTRRGLARPRLARPLGLAAAPKKRPRAADRAATAEEEAEDPKASSDAEEGAAWTRPDVPKEEPGDSGSAPAWLAGPDFLAVFSAQMGRSMTSGAQPNTLIRPRPPEVTTNLSASSGREYASTRAPGTQA